MRKTQEPASDIHIRLSDKIVRRIKICAASEGLTINRFIEKIISQTNSEYLDKIKQLWVD